MKIGFDAKRAVCNMTGLGNYSRLVAEEVACHYPDATLYLYTPTLTETQKHNPRLARLNTLPNVDFRLPYGIGPLGHGALWRSVGITRHFKADGLDLFHGLSNELPLTAASSGIPTVVTIHDLIYLRMPECYRPIDRKMYDWKYGRSARNATRVIAVSECTRRDLVELQQVDPEKIDVIYQGCDPQFRDVCTAETIGYIRRKYNLPQRYLIQVGTIERRKNLALSVRALSALPADVKLVAVGRDNAYLPYVKKVAEELGVTDRLIFLEGIPFNDLPPLYQGSEAVLYPSRYEGFGIPVLEGLQSRRPVIAATGSCLEEAGGDAAWYVDPDDPKTMAGILNAILSGEADLRTHIEHGLLHAARFDTSAMADKIMETYHRAVDDFSNALRRN